MEKSDVYIAPKKRARNYMFTSACVRCGAAVQFSEN